MVRRSKGRPGAKAHKRRHRPAVHLDPDVVTGLGNLEDVLSELFDPFTPMICSIFAVSKAGWASDGCAASDVLFGALRSLHPNDLFDLRGIQSGLGQRRLRGHCDGTIAGGQRSESGIDKSGG